MILPFYNAEKTISFPAHFGDSISSNFNNCYNNIPFTYNGNWCYSGRSKTKIDGGGDLIVASKVFHYVLRLYRSYSIYVGMVWKVNT